jgi:hypothetical protein
MVRRTGTFRPRARGGYTTIGIQPSGATTILLRRVDASCPAEHRTVHLQLRHYFKCLSLFDDFVGFAMQVTITNNKNYSWCFGRKGAGCTTCVFAKYVFLVAVSLLAF